MNSGNPVRPPDVPQWSEYPRRAAYQMINWNLLGRHGWSNWWFILRRMSRTLFAAVKGTLRDTGKALWCVVVGHELKWRVLPLCGRCGKRLAGYDR